VATKELSSCRGCTNNDDKLNKCRVLNKETPEKGFLINCPFMGGGEYTIPKSMYYIKKPPNTNQVKLN
jgi:hypothetical protein